MLPAKTFHIFSLTHLTTLWPRCVGMLLFNLWNIQRNLVSRLFKYFEKKRPTVPRYSVTWDVNSVLAFLKSWHPIKELSLKQLTLKTCMLIALCSSDRAQTIHQMRVDRCVTTARGVEFPIFLQTEDFSSSASSQSSYMPSLVRGFSRCGTLCHCIYEQDYSSPMESCEEWEA